MQLVAYDMCFNLGARGLSNFKKFIAATKTEDWFLASAELVSSTWFTQVGLRSVDHIVSVASLLLPPCTIEDYRSYILELQNVGTRVKVEEVVRKL